MPLESEAKNAGSPCFTGSCSALVGTIPRAPTASPVFSSMIVANPILSTERNDHFCRTRGVSINQKNSVLWKGCFFPTLLSGVQPASLKALQAQTVKPEAQSDLVLDGICQNRGKFARCRTRMLKITVKVAPKAAPDLNQNWGSGSKDF